MRKALVGLIMAATVMTPVAAQAQERERSGVSPRVQERYQRLEQRNQQRHEQRQQRQEARQQQAAPEQRSERRGQRQERRQQRVERPAPQDHGGRRGTRELPSTHGWQGPRTPETRRDADRYDRIARENAMRHGTEQQRREVLQEQRQSRRGDRDWRDDRRDRRQWDRNWRNDRRYDWQDWRYRNRQFYRLSPYYAPYRNHRYSRFSIGVFLGSPFYSQRYWINDPWYYRLPHAPYGTQWVRYYNDVLLVDVYTGEVIDVIYDFFW